MAVLNVELNYQEQVMFDIENILVNKRNDTNRIIQIDMGIANKTISTNFSTSLSEQIMNRHKCSCSMEVCGDQ